MKVITLIALTFVVGILIYIFKSNIYTEQQENSQNLQVSESLSSQDVSILFAGDMNFDRYIRQIGSHNGYAFILKDMSKFMQEGDCVVANLEGPITNNASISVDSKIGSPDNYRFTFDPQTATFLHDHNVCLVNIGNNHIYNFGDEGILSTKELLKNADVAYFGDTGMDENNRTLIKTFGETRIGFVNFNAFVSDALAHTNEDVVKIKEQSDFVVVYAHWGMEYATTSQINERNIAHQFIDSGADVIIGSHPHVIQESEQYKGKMIYYSLGNFVFDQYFQPETQNGLLVRVTFDKDNDILSFQEYSVSMKNTGQTVITQE